MFQPSLDFSSPASSARYAVALPPIEQALKAAYLWAQMSMFDMHLANPFISTKCQNGSAGGSVPSREMHCNDMHPVTPNSFALRIKLFKISCLDQTTNHGTQSAL